MFTWSDDRVCAWDYETAGSRPEYALQPWRIPNGDAWITSLAWVYPQDGKLLTDGGVMPPAETTKQFLEWVIEHGYTVCGWNTPFDISIAMALGFADLCHQVRWLDGRLLWRHFFVEPQYSDAQPRKRYGLKDYVREFLPQYAGYEDGVDFHDQSPEALEKLHAYNVRDNVFTMAGCKRLWHALTPRQRSAAWIEAACLPAVAQANLEGLLIDTVAAQDLRLSLQHRSNALLVELSPDILGGAAARSVKQPKRKPLSEEAIVRKVVASPKMLGTLLFDDWGLPEQKQTDTGNRSADKEVLFELAFLDKRAKQLRDYREALNCSKKFAETPVTAARYNGDGRAHPLMMVAGTYTGRATYSSKQTNKKGDEDVVSG